MITPYIGAKLKPSGLGEALFAKAQHRVLALLFANPDRGFYTNEIVRLADSGIGAVQRELEKLSTSGLVRVSRIGNQKHNQAVDSSILLFIATKTAIAKNMHIIGNARFLAINDNVQNQDL